MILTVEFGPLVAAAPRNARTAAVELAAQRKKFSCKIPAPEFRGCLSKKLDFAGAQIIKGPDN